MMDMGSGRLPRMFPHLAMANPATTQKVTSRGQAITSSPNATPNIAEIGPPAYRRVNARVSQPPVHVSCPASLRPTATNTAAKPSRRIVTRATSRHPGAFEEGGSEGTG